ncbi:hypothetical protein Gbem_4071 [Citrifermentans bemidjiense Bem]|uniref:Uncharacterized protein n=1 Tax=Citrifermentans bemidjiense (strain ATCC BAA-1014 / DSM 16622 / JCM 12645 / Bem) TaxID=404380 RepID=E1P674_CITBB|nr:hypothetical protein Gbem_4071 [Citrifermentans bemidjiense Bem]
MQSGNALVESDKLQEQIRAHRRLGSYEEKQLKEYYRIGLTYSSNALEGNSLTRSSVATTSPRCSIPTRGTISLSSTSSPVASGKARKSICGFWKALTGNNNTFRTHSTCRQIALSSTILFQSFTHLSSSNTCAKSGCLT